MEQFLPGDSVIQQNPREVFAHLATKGYTFHYGWDRKSLNVQVRLDEQIIGMAGFCDDGYAIHCQNVRVEEGYRRQGIANAIYVFAEIAFGKYLLDFWNNMKDSQSAKGRALWAQPNRPFGNPPSKC